MVMDKALLIAVVFLLGLVSGYILFDWQKGNNVARVITKTEVKTDTLFVHLTDTVHVTRTDIKIEHLRDTIFAEPYEAKINAFKTSKAFLYGNTTVSGEVLGDVLKMDIVNDFKIPTITNTITTTNTIIKKPLGIYLVAGVNQQLTPSVGIVLIKDKYLFQITNNSLSLGYKLGN
jgi:hypothetical protein